MSMFTSSHLLLLIYVCFTHALPTLKPYLTPNSKQKPTLAAPRAYMRPVTADPNSARKMAAVSPSSPRSVVAPPRPVEEPSTITAESPRIDGSGVLQAPDTAMSTQNSIGQFLAETGITLSPTNTKFVNMLDRIDFRSLERMCRQHSGLSHANTIVRNVVDNKRGNLANQLQAQVEAMNVDGLMCTVIGKLGSPRDIFRDFEQFLSNIFPLKPPPQPM